MEYVLTDDGKGIKMTDDGKPVVKDSEGKETGLDAIHLATKLPQVNAESRDRRIKIQELEGKLEKFAAITDPEKALAALDTVGKLDAQKLVDAGKIDEVKTALLRDADEKLTSVKTGYETKLQELTKKTQEKDKTIFGLMVSSQFKGSKILESTVLPPEVAESYWGRNFRGEEGKVVGYLNDRPIHSPERPGEYASFEEALAVMIDAEPNKKQFLKSTAGTGSGANDGTAPGSSKKSVPRQTFESWSPKERMTYVKDGGTVT